MTPHHNPSMPHQSDAVFVTDAGLETWLVFQKGFDLPHFAAFPLLRQDKGRAAMLQYIAPFMATARHANARFILDTCTWRANPDWGQRLGFDADDLAAVNRDAVAFAQTARAAFGGDMTVLINGAIGPRGDGYDPGALMTAQQAECYHRFQIAVFAGCGVDLVTGLTLTNTPEAVGIASAAAKAAIPCAISFTVETDGCLPTGEPLADAIAHVDAHCPVPPAYYMINCAHPDHLADAFADGGDWVNRIQGLRANASRMSHAELDACAVLDDGNPQELGEQYADLRRVLPRLNVFGGCCGTDHRHVAEICRAVAAA